MMKAIQNKLFDKPFWFDDSGRRWRTFRASFKKAGVYIIKQKGQIVYVGMSSSCVVEACYRHFYHWRPSSPYSSKRIVTYYDGFKEDDFEVCILETSREQALKLETALIVCLDPRDNAYDGEHQIKEFITKYIAKYDKAESWVGRPVGTADEPDDDLPF